MRPPEIQTAPDSRPAASRTKRANRSLSFTGMISVYLPGLHGEDGGERSIFVGVCESVGDCSEELSNVEGKLLLRAVSDEFRKARAASRYSILSDSMQLEK